jgi:hypothetical protein
MNWRRRDRPRKGFRGGLFRPTEKATGEVKVIADFVTVRQFAGGVIDDEGNHGFVERAVGPVGWG